jgi:hypothetical protein
MSTKALQVLVLAMAVAVGFAAIARAGDDAQTVTVSGTIQCAKCLLGKEDAKACQDVLVAEDKTEYYFVKNAVADEHGHACKTSKAVVVTGKVTEKDGRKWIEATKIELPKKG